MRLDNFSVGGSGLKVTGSFLFETENISGQSSGTESSFDGIKPKRFAVALVIDYEKPNELKKLIRVAESVDANGDLKIFDCVEKTINAASVSQVKFVGRFRFVENDTIRSWNVSFELEEHISTAQKVEQRQAKAEAPQQPAPNVTAGYEPGRFISDNVQQLIGYSDEALS